MFRIADCTQEQFDDIEEKFMAGWSIAKLARQYDCHRKTMKKIIVMLELERETEEEKKASFKRKQEKMQYIHDNLLLQLADFIWQVRVEMERKKKKQKGMVVSEKDSSNSL